MSIIHQDPNASVSIPSLAENMVQHGFGAVMDNMLSEMVWDHRETIHDIVDAMIAQRKRVEGKGRYKSSAAGQRNSAPQYTTRDPKVAPTSAELRHSCFTMKPSRSDMEDILERGNSVSTYGQQWEQAYGDCKAAVQRIIDEARRKKLKYFDDSFYFDKRDNMYPDGAPADCTVAEPKQCVRLQEMFPKANVFEDKITPDDITQGEVGDCFLIGAISALASADPSHIRDLFVHFDVEVGVYGLVFYKCGGWEWVIVDDFVPYVKERSGGRYPLFASSTGDRVELWPLILEKAYAKLHYNWSTVDGGWAKEALVDMTGGTPTTLDFTTRDAEMPFDRFMAMANSQHTVLACSVPESVKEVAGGAAGRAGEASALYGLFKGHQYAVIDAKQTSDGVGFVQCRNPWGNEAEWRGPYSDNSVDWSRNTLHKREINPAFADDGSFWMRFSDFKKYLGVVDVVTTFPDDHVVLTMFGKASKDMTPENTYVLQVTGEAMDLSIVLAQDDPKIKYGKEGMHEKQFATYASLRFTIYKMREIPNSHDDIRDHMQGKIVSNAVRERNTCLTQRLEPGAYIIFPTVHVATGKGGADDELGVYLRVFGPPKGSFALTRPYDSKLNNRTDLELISGKCVSLKEAKGKGPEALGLLTGSFSPLRLAERAGSFLGNALGLRNKMARGAVTSNGEKAPPAAVWDEASAVFSLTNNGGSLTELLPALGYVEASTAENLKKELQDGKDYVTQLEALLKRQQDQIASLNAQVMAAKSTATGRASQAADGFANTSSSPDTSAHSPAPPSSGATTARSRAPSSPQAGGGGSSDDNAWNRLRLSKERLEELISIVFVELGGGNNLSVEDAVNGVRLLVTTGTGLDDIAYGHPVAGSLSSKSIDVASFTKLCNDSIMQWQALKK